MHGTVIDRSNTLGDLRHYCRNPRCRSKLPEPTSTTRDAFCARGCYLGFYRTRCAVCEKSFERKNEREKLCGRRKCRAAFKRDRAHYLGSRYGIAPDVVEPSRSVHFTGVKTRLIPDRAWRIIAGPAVPEINLRIPLDSATADRTARTNRGYWAGGTKAALQPHHPPINVVGGYKFPDAPEIDLNPTSPAPVIEPSAPAPIASADRDLSIPADLSIPNFMRRTLPAESGETAS
jgi:hypothetical protein